VGDTYCFGGNSERKNLEVVHALCAALDELRPRANGQSYRELITFVTDRPGHDFRYAIDDSKAQRELGYVHHFKNFESGLKETIAWYLAHLDWSKKVTAKPGVKVTYEWDSIK
jgi:dTDP-glucose 4,6-dehydratase